MPTVIRRFERRDRDQLTYLINLHVAAVIPGVVLSVNAVLSQLEREPGEAIVDPWVTERYCLVAERDRRIVAAALLHRFGTEEEVSESYRGSGEVRWLVCQIAAMDEGRMLVAAVMEQMRRWQVVNVGVDCALPAPGCYGIPDAMPHSRTLIDEAGFGEPARGEMVLAARCEDLVRPDLTDDIIVRTVGTLGTRLTLSAGDTAGGYIEVCQPGTDLTRSSLAPHWAHVGNLILADDADPAVVIPISLSCAARWLLLGGVTRLMDHWIIDVDSPNYVEALQRAGFVILGRNNRGFTRSC